MLQGILSLIGKCQAPLANPLHLESALPPESFYHVPGALGIKMSNPVISHQLKEPLFLTWCPMHLWVPPPAPTFCVVLCTDL